MVIRLRQGVPPMLGYSESVREQAARQAELLDFGECTTLAALIESFCSAEVISFSTQFAHRCRRSRALLAWAWLCLR